MPRKEELYMNKPQVMWGVSRGGTFVEYSISTLFQFYHQSVMIPMLLSSTYPWTYPSPLTSSLSSYCLNYTFYHDYTILHLLPCFTSFIYIEKLAGNVGNMWSRHSCVKSWKPACQKHACFKHAGFDMLCKAP